MCSRFGSTGNGKGAQYKILCFFMGFYRNFLYLVEEETYTVRQKAKSSITDRQAEIVSCLFLCYKERSTLYDKDSNITDSFSVRFYVREERAFAGTDLFGRQQAKKEGQRSHWQFAIMIQEEICVRRTIVV